MAADLITARQRYENINKQQLIDDRLVELATNINFLRSQAHDLNAKIHKT